MIKIKIDWFFTLTGFAGMTLAPFVLYKTFPDWYTDKNKKIFWNHEGIHIKQQYELFLVGFYVLYLYYYLKGRFNGLKHIDAYSVIPFELEASEHENDLKYVDNRQKNAWKLYA